MWVTLKGFYLLNLYTILIYIYIEFDCLPMHNALKILIILRKEAPIVAASPDKII